MGHPLWLVWLLLVATSLAASVLLGPLFDTHPLLWRGDQSTRVSSRRRAAFWSGLNDLVAAVAVGALMGLGAVLSLLAGCCFAAGKVSFADGLTRFVHQPLLGGYTPEQAEGDQRAAKEMSCARLLLFSAAVGVLNTWSLFLLVALVARLANGR